MTRAWLRGLSAALIPPLVLGVSAPAMAQMVVSRNPASTAPILGTVVRGTTSSTFSISTSGVVTRTSGDAIRLQSTGVTAPTILIACNLSVTYCTAHYMRVIVTTAGATGTATITRFFTGNLQGTTYRTGSAPTAASSLDFELNPVGLSLGASFVLGMDVTVPGAAASGAGTYSYTVTVDLI